MKESDALRRLGVREEEVEQEVAAAVEGISDAELMRAYEESIKNFQVDTILKGRIVGVVGERVLVDVGYKSEGEIALSEFPRPGEVKPNDEIEVFLESVEGESGLIMLSKQKADRIRGWERIIQTHKEGDSVRGRAIRKIKGGLLVDIGVPVFLPASQVDIRRVEDIGEYLGRDLECKIIKIDEKRMNIIVSRRKLLEEQREELKKKLLAEIKEGEVRRGVVKNIADFGAFVDLGGIDGLLHITDMCWGRISHPSEMLTLDQPLDVKILKVDLNRERIALGLKQLTPSPWEQVPQKYPPGTKVRGRVVNMLPYGAFVELETGVEGLVHVSEMSWTKRVNNPSEVVAIGDMVDVVVLSVNMEKQEISLGMKQLETNPWTLLEQKYPPGTRIHGRVRNITTYGAFIEIEEHIDGFLHVSDMSWTKRINHPSELLKKGDRVETVVLNVNPEKKRVTLGMKQLKENPWETIVPTKYSPGSKVQGVVTKLTNFGAFVKLEEDLEGLLHISKMGAKDADTHDKPLVVGDKVEVQVIRLDPREGKIGLKLIGLLETTPKAKTEKGEEAAPQPAASTAPDAAEPRTVDEDKGASLPVGETGAPVEKKKEIPPAAKVSAPSETEAQGLP